MATQYDGAPVTGTPMWQVVKVEDTFGPTSFGGNNRMKRVTYRMANGDQSYVDVAYDSGWVAKASAEIEQAVMDHVDALQLRSNVST